MTSAGEAAPEKPFSSVRVLLAGAIDYAGLFPPSAVSMSEAVANYAAYKHGEYSWMLGRFVVTASRLNEFAAEAAMVLKKGEKPWHVAVVAGDDIELSTYAVVEFNAVERTRFIADVMEVKAPTVEDIENAYRIIPRTVTAYYEVPLTERLPELIATLALRDQRAKIRTGGITPEAFPKEHDIVRFVRACSAANLPFKATAGLHHPLRCHRPLTYEPDAVTGRMHGFLNLFLMAAFVRDGRHIALLDELMAARDASEFRFDETGVRWRNEYVLTLWQLQQARLSGIQSFGSCSFVEPIVDLKELGIF
ncbi:MAG: hypothetical protein UZ17_ACD001001919 [Acidobacteria bacterium OLB17]|nr:MAG: hypothetical protein UZ17_ACD001001919 [Acidobacteria bacterium OLB17]